MPWSTERRLIPSKWLRSPAFAPVEQWCFTFVTPGAGFRRESLDDAAIANPAVDPAAHIEQREAEGIRPGGYGLLLAAGTVDELIYNEIGNEVLLIKYVDPTSAVNKA